MKENHLTGILGTTTTGVGAVISWLPTVNLIVQIIAGLVAIVVGLSTIRYYQKKIKTLENKR